LDLNGMTAEERQKSLAQLVAQGDDRATQLIGAALRDSHWPVCDEFAGALAQIGGEAAKAQLLLALKARRHHVRSAATRVLATWGGDNVREAIQALANDPSYEVRQDVAQALARLHEHR
jgi:HEAT repeat protein